MWFSSTKKRPKSWLCFFCFVFLFFVFSAQACHSYLSVPLPPGVRTTGMHPSPSSKLFNNQGPFHMPSVLNTHSQNTQQSCLVSLKHLRCISWTFLAGNKNSPFLGCKTTPYVISKVTNKNGRSVTNNVACVYMHLFIHQKWIGYFCNFDIKTILRFSCECFISIERYRIESASLKKMSGWILSKKCVGLIYLIGILVTYMKSTICSVFCHSRITTF